MATKPNLALLLGREPGGDEDDELELEDEDLEQDDDAHAGEVVSLLDRALDRELSTSERYDAFAEAIALCQEG
jgi:hypothetical protein